VPNLGKLSDDQWLEVRKDIDSFFTNSMLGVTKDAYFDICEELGNEPVEEEIPVEFEDLMLDVQDAIGVYNKLKDEYDGMSGRYTGKNYSGIKDILELLDVPFEERQTTFKLVTLIDEIRKRVLNEKNAAEHAAAESAAKANTPRK
jgi:hypothetical protein